MQLRAIIVEDEFRVRQVLVKLLKQHCPQVELIAEAENIDIAYDLIVKHKPDIVFLDIEMPGGNGFDLLSKFDEILFETIFVTSYGHYAINAIKYSALDYLMKPVIVEELKLAVSKAVIKTENKNVAQKYQLLKENLEDINKPKKLAVSDKGRLYHIDADNIIYLEAKSNYTTIHLIDGSEQLAAKTLGDYEEILCDANSLFVRIHKSYIVNIKFVDHLEKGEDATLVLTNNIKLEISRRKRAELQERLNSVN